MWTMTRLLSHSTGGCGKLFFLCVGHVDYVDMHYSWPEKSFCARWLDGPPEAMVVVFYL